MCSNTSYGDSAHHLGSHHYADLFAADGNEVFWIGSPLHVFNLVRAARGSAAEQQAVAAWRAGGVSARKDVLSYHPFTFLPYRDAPALGSRAVMERTMRFTMPPLKSALRERGFDAPDLLWLAQSHASVSVMKLITGRKMAYRVSDSILDMPTVPKTMREGEAEILARADVVFATAHRLLEEVRAVRTENVFYLPNGVDFEHFQVSADTPEPEDMAGFRRPRILYVGAISVWFDVALAAEAARALPDYDFIYIGRVDIDIRDLTRHSNVHILGPRPYALLPPYMRHADAAIIPFLKNRITDATSPIKLFEYAAAGLPIVSARLYETEMAQSPAVLTDNAADFVSAIREAVAGGRDHPELTAFGKANSWAKRYELIREQCL